MEKKKFFTTGKIILVVVIFLAIFFAKFPTLYHWLNPPKGYFHPKQTSWYDAWDTNFQVSYIRYGQRQGIALQNTYTTVPHQSVYIYQFYTILGVMNRVLKLDPFVLFHLSSVVMSILLILGSYWITKIFFKDRIYHLSAFIVTVLGGGFGFLPFIKIAADKNIAGFTFINAFERGHDALSTLLLLMTFTFIYLYAKENRRINIYLALSSSILSITLHAPFAVLYVVLGIIVFCWQYLQTQKYLFLIYPFFILIFFALYGYFALLSLFSNSGFRGVVEQNLFNVDSFSLILGFGLISIFIFWSLVFLRENSLEHPFAKMFFLILLIFTLSPFGFHLYFVKGVFFFGVILGFMGIRDVFKDQKLQSIVITIVVLTSLATRISIFNTLLNAKLNNSFLFLTLAEGKALEYMGKLPVGSAVLSLYRIGNYIPAFSDTKVYYGHNFQTPDSKKAKKMAMDFYTKMQEKERAKFLQENNIQYIYYGLEEANLRNNEKLDIKNPFPNYPILYQNDSSIIYAVNQPI